MKLCLQSVQGWAKSRGYAYQLVGDEIFQLVPEWYRQKAGEQLPVATDFGRLILMQLALDKGIQTVMWFDADVLIFDMSLQIEFEGTCAFGQEVWVQAHEDTYAVRKNVHNAFCAFRQGCPVLPFLRYTVESLIRRVDPAHIAPQMAGPKLLTSLHSLCAFALIPEVGALSPVVIRDICAGKGPALDLLRRKSLVKPKAVNLCASVINPEQAQKAISILQGKV